MRPRSQRPFSIRFGFLVAMSAPSPSEDQERQPHDRRQSKRDRRRAHRHGVGDPMGLHGRRRVGVSLVRKARVTHFVIVMPSFVAASFNSWWTSGGSETWSFFTGPPESGFNCDAKYFAPRGKITHRPHPHPEPTKLGATVTSGPR